MVRLPSNALVVLVGASGSGKSAWAARWFRPEQVVASDDLRAVVGETAMDLRASADAFELLERIVEMRLGRGLLTVVDTLGLDADRRARWLDVADRHHRPAYAVVFATPAATCRARNRARAKPLPGRVLDGQLRAVRALDGHVEGFEAIDPEESVQVVPPSLVPAAAATDRQREGPLAMRFGLQIARFDRDPAELRPWLAEVAKSAEDVGFDSLWVMDHVLQIPHVGREWDPILESQVTLGYLAGVTDRIRLGTLVTGVTYRHITLLGKMLATLDVLSGGRAICGLGAAWFEREHVAYGWRFPELRERYALLRDALELLPLLWGPGSPRFEGRTVTVEEAICYPRPLQERIPILVGGGGERTTLRLVAEYADACNLFGSPEQVARKVAVLHRHCADVDRDPAEIEVTSHSTVLTAPDAGTLADRIERLRPPDASPETYAARVNAGVTDEQIGRFRAYAEVGVGTAIVTMPEIDPERVAELAPLVAAFRSA